MPIHDTPFGAVDLTETGAGDTAVVLLHAGLSSPRALARLTGRLAVPGRRIIAPALSGYGATRVTGAAGVLDENLRVARFALSLAAGSRRRVLVGHSVGGLIALRTAVDGAAIDALAVYEPVAFGVLDRSVPEEAAADAWDGAIARRVLDGMAAGDPAAGVAGFVEAWNDTPWAALPAAARAHLLTQAPRLTADMPMVRDDTWTASAYAGIRAPTLVMQGDRGPAAVGFICRRLAAAIGDSHLELVPGAGHMAPVLQPDQIADRIEQFLAAI